MLGLTERVYQGLLRIYDSGLGHVCPIGRICARCWSRIVDNLKGGVVQPGFAFANQQQTDDDSLGVTIDIQDNFVILPISIDNGTILHVIEGTNLLLSVVVSGLPVHAKPKLRLSSIQFRRPHCRAKTDPFSPIWIAVENLHEVGKRGIVSNRRNLGRVN